MTTIRQLFVELDVKGDAQKKLKGFNLSITDVKSGLELVANGVRIAADAIATFTTDMANAGDVAAKTAKNLGISVQAVQELDFAAKLSGVGINEVRTAVQRMQKGLNDARQRGTGPFADAVKQLGKEVSDFDGLEPDEIFTRLSEELSKQADATTRAALAQDLFGRGGKTLLPLINEGAEGIRGMREEFQALGGGFTDDGAAAAESFNDSMLRLNTVIDSVKIAIGEALFPVIEEIIQEIQAWAMANREAIQEELTAFLGDVIEGARSLAPAIRDLLPILGDFARFVGTAIVETGQLFREIKQLDERLTEDYGPAWTMVKEIMATVIAPITKVGDLFDWLVEKIDSLLSKLESAGGVFSRFSDTVRGGLAKVGIITDDDRVSTRGAPRLSDGRTVADVRRADKSGRVTLNKATPRQLREALANPNNSAQQKAAIAAFLPSAVAREESFREGQRVINSLARAKFKEDQKAAREAEKARKRAGRGGGKKGGAGRKSAAGAKKKTDERISDDELVKLISRAGRTGKSLTGLLGDRKLEGSSPPVIAVTVTNYNVEQAVNAPVTVNGVPGSSAEEIGKMVEEKQRALLQDEFRRALEAIEPVVDR